MSTHRTVDTWRAEVAAELEQRKRSIAWLAAECGYSSRSNLWQCVTGKAARRPTVDMMERVERVIGVRTAACPVCGAVVDAVEGRR